MPDPKFVYQTEVMAAAALTLATQTLRKLMARGTLTREEVYALCHDASALHLQSPAGENRLNLETGALLTELCEELTGRQ